MPTYDYLCDSCKHKFEHFQTITSDLLKKCPECGKRKLRRLFGTGAAVVFKGSGFYQTDYRSEKYKSAAAADKPAAETSSESKSGESKSTETKAADSKASGNGAAKDAGSKSKSKSKHKE